MFYFPWLTARVILQNRPKKAPPTLLWWSFLKKPYVGIADP
jgi:hypothetical protein